MKVKSEDIKKNLASIGMLVLQQLVSAGASKFSEFLDKKKNSIKNSGTEIASQNSQDSDKTKV